MQQLIKWDDVTYRDAFGITVILYNTAVSCCYLRLIQGKSVGQSGRGVQLHGAAYLDRTAGTKSLIFIRLLSARKAMADQLMVRDGSIVSSVYSLILVKKSLNPSNLARDLNPRT